MAARRASASPKGILEAGEEGTEAVAVLLIGGEADDGDGAAVEVVGCRR